MHDFNSCSEINHFNFFIFVYLQSSNLASSNVIPLLLEPLQQIPKYSLLLKVKYLFKFQYIIETFIAHVSVTDLMVIFFPSTESVEAHGNGSPWQTVPGGGPLQPQEFPLHYEQWHWTRLAVPQRLSVSITLYWYIDAKSPCLDISQNLIPLYFQYKCKQNLPQNSDIIFIIIFIMIIA